MLLFALQILHVTKKIMSPLIINYKVKTVCEGGGVTQKVQLSSDIMKKDCPHIKRHTNCIICGLASLKVDNAM